MCTCAAGRWPPARRPAGQRRPAPRTQSARGRACHQPPAPLHSQGQGELLASNKLCLQKDEQAYWFSAHLRHSLYRMHTAQCRCVQRCQGGRPSGGCPWHACWQAPSVQAFARRAMVQQRRSHGRLGAGTSCPQLKPRRPKGTPARGRSLRSFCVFALFSFCCCLISKVSEIGNRINTQ